MRGFCRCALALSSLRSARRISPSLIPRLTLIYLPSLCPRSRVIPTAPREALPTLEAVSSISHATLASPTRRETNDASIAAVFPVCGGLDKGDDGTRKTTVPGGRRAPAFSFSRVRSPRFCTYDLWLIDAHPHPLSSVPPFLRSSVLYLASSPTALSMHLILSKPSVQISHPARRILTTTRRGTERRFDIRRVTDRAVSPAPAMQSLRVSREMGALGSQS